MALLILILTLIYLISEKKATGLLPGTVKLIRISVPVKALLF